MTGRNASVLVVDDEKNARTALAEILADDGYQTAEAANGTDALNLIGEIDPDVVVTDLKMPGMNGIDLIEKGRVRSPHVTFVVMTAYGSIQSAVDAIKRGADHYFTKPLDPETVLAVVARAAARTALSRDATGLRHQLEGRGQAKRILGDHPLLHELLTMVDQVAQSRATVLIRGESGTGKELVASAIHYGSDRRGGPFVKLNCAALAETLLESELFGHEKGSFTGAAGRREGRFMQADGGTLFLDEVSEIPTALQVKLLRFLQEREFERVGGNDVLSVDARVVAATNRDLRTLVTKGAFREDLFYRLNVVELEVPPLRARPSDIPVLARHFASRFAAENKKTVDEFAKNAMEAMIAYSWPGNVRELENAMERAVVLAGSNLIELKNLPPFMLAHAVGESRPTVPGSTMADIERWAITTAFKALESPSKVAKSLGISRRTVQYRLKEWGLNSTEASSPPSSSDDPTPS